jgi:hypothetical protein
MTLISTSSGPGVVRGRWWGGGGATWEIGVTNFKGVACSSTGWIRTLDHREKMSQMHWWSSTHLVQSGPSYIYATIQDMNIMNISLMKQTMDIIHVHRWAHLLKQKSSNDVYRLLTKETNFRFLFHLQQTNRSLLFPFSICSKQTKIAILHYFSFSYIYLHIYIYIWICYWKRRSGNFR